MWRARASERVGVAARVEDRLLRYRIPRQSLSLWLKGTRHILSQEELDWDQKTTRRGARMARGKQPNRPRRRGLSKSRVMAYRQCPKRLWLATYRADLADMSGAATPIADGNAVGEVARRLHPGGQLIQAENSNEQLALTTQALAARPKIPLYEATFSFERTLVRADLMFPRRGGYRLVEVKASGSVKDYQLDDVAIQTWVIERAGVPLKRLEIAHVDTQFVYPGREDYEGLLAYEDVEDAVSERLDEVGEWVAEAKEILAGPEPEIAPGPQCADPYPCPFAAYCIPAPAQGVYPLAELGGRSRRLIAELEAEDYANLRKVPAKRLSKPRHQLMHRAIRSGEQVLLAEAREALQDLGWPRRYLDFETVRFAVPIWAGTRPYQQVPFQWSCHIEKHPGKLIHQEFLAEGTDDPRRAFAESLVAVLGEDEGPIFVYNASFEKTRMTELAEAFPDLAPALRAAIERIVDLYPLMRNNYYHRDQRGSWSLKALLPTIAPELDYRELDISEGASASEAYCQLLNPATPKNEAAALRAALREYCARDTLALVRIVEYVEQGGA